MKVLVTGATGVLGSRLVPKLRGAGHVVRIMSRRQLADPTAVRGDLGTGHGVQEAVEGIEAVVHAASATTRPWSYHSVDVEGTRRLLQAAKRANVRHFLYPSIVGMEGVPHPYFKPKLLAEGLVVEAGVAWTIMRATQFYSLFDQMIRLAARLPVLALPARWTIQPIDPAEVADQVVLLLGAGPSGRTPSVGGPEVRTLGEMAEAWVQHRGLRRRVVNFPIPGRLSRAFASGQMTCPEQAVGRVRWEDWLDRQAEGSAEASPAR